MEFSECGLRGLGGIDFVLFGSGNHPSRPQTDARRKTDLPHPLLYALVHRGKEHYRKFQALGGVNGHDAHRMNRIFGRRIGITRVGLAHQLQFFHEIRKREP